MSKEHLHGFLNKIKANPELKAILKKLESAEDIRRLASEHGYDIDEDDLRNISAVGPVFDATPFDADTQRSMGLSLGGFLERYIVNQHKED